MDDPMKYKTARQLIAALKKLPPDMPVSFLPVASGWLGSSSPLYAFQVNVWSRKGNSARKPYPKSAAAEIYVSVEPR